MKRKKTTTHKTLRELALEGQRIAQVSNKDKVKIRIDSRTEYEVHPNEVPELLARFKLTEPCV